MKKPSPIIWAVLALGVVALIIVVIVFRAQSANSLLHTDASEVEAAADVASGAAHVEGGDSGGSPTQSSYELNPADLLTVPATSKVTGFSLGSADAPTFSVAKLRDVNAVIEEIESQTNAGFDGGNMYGGMYGGRQGGGRDGDGRDGDGEVEGESSCSCGFVFLNVGTGRGLAYNAGEVMYIASAAKAPVSLYALTHGAGASAYEREDIEQTITYSDNDSFEAFAYTYATADYVQWLGLYEAYHDDAYYDLYPMMSARSLAAFWAEILQYVQAGSPDAKWFASLLESTDTSFIRDAIGEKDVVVMNKGGWNSEEGFESVSDAAIVQEDGRTYLMVIVTNQPDGGVSEANVTALASALFALRSSL